MDRILAPRIVACVALVLIAATGCSPTTIPPPQPEPAAAPPVPEAVAPPPKLQSFSATAYSIHGHTKSGTKARVGVVAADPKVLPIGSRIRVTNAGNYSGVYRVEDTGQDIDGHEIDIYIPSEARARRFGRRQVQVEILTRGGGSAQQAAQ